ncbi:MAG: hypothetical protein ACRDV1_05415 [Actinomycetes bacterium]
MSDVVGQGDGDRPQGYGALPGRRAVVVLVLLVLLLGGWWAVRSGVLPGTTTDGSASSKGPRVVTLEGNRLVLRGIDGDQTSLRLPHGLGQDGPLFVVEGTGRPAVVGVADGTLYRVEPRPGGSVSALGPALAVLAAPAGSGEVLVLVDGPAGPAVVSVRAATGAVADRAPFPGFDPLDGRTPRAALTTFGPLGLLMSQPTGHGEEKLSVAWTRDAVDAGWAGQQVPLNQPGRLLGASGDWVLVLHGDCPGADCRLDVVTVRPHAATAREVHPPAGWSFAPGPVAGRAHEVLVPVVDLARGRRALARLVSGGDNALFVRGTEAVHQPAGMVEGGDGAVYLAVQRRDGAGLDVRAWRREAAGLAASLEGPALPGSARLVCVCR